MNRKDTQNDDLSSSTTKQTNKHHTDGRRYDSRSRGPQKNTRSTMMRIPATSSQFSLLTRRSSRIYKRSIRVEIPCGNAGLDFLLMQDQQHAKNDHYYKHGRLHIERNRTHIMPCVLPLDEDQRQSQLQQQQPARRQYHSTPRQPILPLIVGCVAVAGGYVLYRKLQGASVVPDEAAKAKEAYRKQQGKFSSNSNNTSGTTSSTDDEPATTTSSNSCSSDKNATTKTKESPSQQETTKS